MTLATDDVRKLKGMVAIPEKPVTVADMNRAIVIEGSRVNDVIERPLIMAKGEINYKES